MTVLNENVVEKKRKKKTFEYQIKYVERVCKEQSASEKKSSCVLPLKVLKKLQDELYYYK